MGLFLSVCLSLYSVDSFWALICCCFVNYCFIVLILLTCLSDQSDCFPAFVVPFPGFVDGLPMSAQIRAHIPLSLLKYASGGLTGAKLRPSHPRVHNDAGWKTLNTLWVSRGLLGAFRVESWELRTERYDYLWYRPHSQTPKLPNT